MTFVLKACLYFKMFQKNPQYRIMDGKIVEIAKEIHEIKIIVMVWHEFCLLYLHFSSIR